MSSLGQYRAFQHDRLGAAHCFREALAQFASIASVNVEESKQQMAQTGTYLAIVSMDTPDFPVDDLQSIMEKTLGMSVLQALKEVVANPLQVSRYRHYLLTRYLVCKGRQEEKALYLRGSGQWCQPDLGFQVGHPWPQIQYFRWLLTDPEDRDLRRALQKSLYPAKGEGVMPTVDCIVAAIAISMGILDPKKDSVRAMLLRLSAVLPEADCIQQMLYAKPGDAYLAKRLLPFNFC